MGNVNSTLSASFISPDTHWYIPLLYVAAPILGLLGVSRLSFLVWKNWARIVRWWNDFRVRFHNYDIDQNSWWVQFIKMTKLPGLKDLIRPGLSVYERIVWVIYYLFLTALGIAWGIFLSMRMAEHPTTVTIHERNIPVKCIAAPKIIVGKPYNLEKSALAEITEMSSELAFETVVEDIYKTQWSKAEILKLGYTAKTLCNAQGINARWKNIAKDSRLPQNVSNEDAFEFLTKLEVDLLDNAKEETDLFRNKIVKYLRKGMKRCTDMFTACTFAGQRIDCSEMISEVQTDLGPGCAFNNMPESAMRKEETIQSLLTEQTVCPEDVEIWKKFVMEENLLNPFVRNKTCINQVQSFQSTIPLTQPLGGVHFGFSFVAQFDLENGVCPKLKTNAFLLEIISVFDDSEMGNNGINIPYDHDVTIVVEPVYYVPEKGLNTALGKTVRDCFYSNETEAKLDFYRFFTEANCNKECVSKAIVKECGCGLVNMPNKQGETLCTLAKDIACGNMVMASRTLDCKGCLSSCAGMRYKIASMSQVPYTQSTKPDIVALTTKPGLPTAHVNIFVRERFAFGTVRNNAYDAIDVFAEAGGASGTTNGISMVDFGRLIEAIVKTLKNHRGEISAALIAYFSAKLRFFIERKQRRPGPEDGVVAVLQEENEMVRITEENTVVIIDEDERRSRRYRVMWRQATTRFRVIRRLSQRVTPTANERADQQQNRLDATGDKIGVVDIVDVEEPIPTPCSRVRPLTGVLVAGKWPKIQRRKKAKMVATRKIMVAPAPTNTSPKSRPISPKLGESSRQIEPTPSTSTASYSDGTLLPFGGEGRRVRLQAPQEESQRPKATAAFLFGPGAYFGRKSNKVKPKSPPRL